MKLEPTDSEYELKRRIAQLEHLLNNEKEKNRALLENMEDMRDYYHGRIMALYGFGLVDL
jgi:hypothetical protein